MLFALVELPLQVPERAEHTHTLSALLYACAACMVQLEDRYETARPSRFANVNKAILMCVVALRLLKTLECFCFANFGLLNISAILD